MSTAVAILDTFRTEDGAVVEVTFNMAGGASHEEREAAALAGLEAFKERSGRPVAGPMSYEVRRFGRDMDFRFSVEPCICELHSPDDFVGTLQQTPHAG